MECVNYIFFFLLFLWFCSLTLSLSLSLSVSLSLSLFVIELKEDASNDYLMISVIFVTPCCFSYFLYNKCKKWHDETLK